MPAAGTLSNLVVTLGNNVGLGVQYVFTAYHNGVADAALQCTVTGTGYPSGRHDPRTDRYGPAHDRPCHSCGGGGRVLLGAQRGLRQGDRWFEREPQTKT